MTYEDQMARLNIQLQIAKIRGETEYHAALLISMIELAKHKKNAKSKLIRRKNEKE